MPLRTWGTYHLNYRNTNHIDYGQNVGSLAKTPPKKRNAEVGLVPGGKYRVYVGADAQAPQNSWVIFVYNYWIVPNVGRGRSNTEGVSLYK